jgi:speckle-type POZ protein
MAADAATTAEELQAAIERQRRRAERIEQQIVEAQRELEAAEERQQLRRILEEQTALADTKADALCFKKMRRERIDQDITGQFVPAADYSRSASTHVLQTTNRGREAIAYDANVAAGDYEWEIQGLSWLRQSLELEARDCIASRKFQIDTTDVDSTYKLAFSPSAASFLHRDDDEFSVFDPALRGSLALIRISASYGAIVDVGFFVKEHPSGVYVPWGGSRRVAWQPPDGESACLVLGPDLDEPLKGVFGLPFARLLESPWVRNDAITFKVVIKEIAMNETEHIRLDWPADQKADQKGEPELAVPPPTLGADMLTMLTEGRHTDLTIETDGPEPGVPGPLFRAHAAVLSVRSDVFRAALTHGMQESATRTIRVRDVPPLALKALLHFLYADDFGAVEAVLAEEEEPPPQPPPTSCMHMLNTATSPPQPPPTSAAAAAAEGEVSGGSSGSSGGSSGVSGSSSSGGSSGGGSSGGISGGSGALRMGQRMGRLRTLLAAAHRYQLFRLLRWCEQQLCEILEGETVCELLELALLYEASSLEGRCLKHLRARMSEVVQQPAFRALSREALVRVHMHCAGVNPAELSGRKRKRFEEHAEE